ncbi:capsid protein [Heterobasidion partitivirus 15]|uniref:Capsid protein n=1 Tax=Heterobasidion partitivirus 15 TaxID=1469908 RepID=W8PA50_9VIRU|nr:capsid protein [Heterobasidion partitivirus 15]AHL25163.1 capsid protein [Heterobasidion partitivirus 15]
MSATKMEDYLNGKLDAAALNKADIEAYAAAQIKAQKDLIEASTSASKDAGSDPLGMRDVHKQAQDSVQAQSQPTSTNLRPPRFQKVDDTDAINAHRLVLMDDPFTHVSKFGNNFVVPDFHHAFTMLDEMDNIMLSTKKFTDISETWTPLMSRYFFGSLLLVHTLRVQREADAVTPTVANFLDQFEKDFPLHSIPIPGPMVNFFECLAASNVAVAGFDPVSPILPKKANVTTRAKLLFNNNLAGRIPHPLIMLDQMHVLINAMGNGDRATRISNVANCSVFFNGIFSIGMSNAASADPYEQTPVHAVNTANHIAWVFSYPDVAYPVLSSYNAASSFVDNINQLRRVLPARLDLSGAGNATQLEWPEFVSIMEYPRLFRYILRLMAEYSKFWKGSKSLDLIPLAGKPSLQVAFTKDGAEHGYPTTRFPTFTHSFTGAVRRSQISPADRIDAATSVLNYSHLADGGGIDRANPGIPRQGGPFFDDSEIVLRTRNINPSLGYGSVATEKYHLKNTK